MVFRRIRGREVLGEGYSHAILCLSTHQQAGFPPWGKIDRLQVTGTTPIKSYSTLFPFRGVASN
jgi:hypothetical protein